MNIVLDTNIIMQNFLMDSGEFVVLFDYLEKTASKIIMPEIVYKEVMAHYGREFDKRVSEYVKSKNHINSILIEGSIADFNLDKESNKVEYKKYFDTKIGLLKNNTVLASKDSVFKSVIERAINHIKPCSDGDKGYLYGTLFLIL
jgi:predicted nucleic acid-binding protein